METPGPGVLVVAFFRGEQQILAVFPKVRHLGST